MFILNFLIKRDENFSHKFFKNDLIYYLIILYLDFSTFYENNYGASLNANAVTAFWWPEYSRSMVPDFTFHNFANPSDEAETNPIKKMFETSTNFPTCL